MAIILNPLKESLDNITTLVKFLIKVVFGLGIDFIGNAHCCRMLFKIITD